jgi:integrase
MREGELCGLRWADVDLKSRTLWVRRSVARDNGKYYVKPPKTRTSVRDIPLTLALAEKLKARKDAQETELIVAGLEPSEERMSQIYVLGEVDGSFMKPHGLWRPWKALADSMGLVGTQGRRPTFHDLRNTALSEIPTSA